uniref:PH domain-containing protein n=1 Tax=Denticeps clupeoides TaxID=299321 RepID=A0AAY4ERM3_9TELE
MADGDSNRQLRRNWKERWFTLKPNSLSYFTNEDQKDHKGSIALDMNCCVEQSTIPTHCSPGACHGCPRLTQGVG